MKRSLAVVIFDIDYFKSINDTYGHQAGDRVIKEVARVLQVNCRSIDIPCRYGGEEFTVILPETGKDEAVIFAERIRAVVEGLRIEYEESTIRLSVSGGYRSVPELQPKDSNELMEMADLALYHAKKSGRNSVFYYDPSMRERRRPRYLRWNPFAASASTVCFWSFSTSEGERVLSFDANTTFTETDFFPSGTGLPS